MKSHSDLEGQLEGTVRATLTRQSLHKEELLFDRERARTLLSVLYTQFISEEKGSIDIAIDAPQWKYLPKFIERGSSEHKIWLFSSGSTDLRAKSADVYHTHQRLWENRKWQLPFGLHTRSTNELYTPEVLSWSREEFTWALAKCGFGNPRRNVDWWKRRASTLWELWDGDPFRMFELGTINALMSWKSQQHEDPLPGVGPKIASLIAIFFEEIGMSSIPDAFPVDVHVQRLALALRIVVPTRIAPIMNETLEEILRPEIVKLCKEEGWSRILLSHAMWFRGNRGCTNCWKTPYTQIGCPVYEDCQGAYLSRPYFKMGLWRPEAGPMAKGGKAPLVPFTERPLFL